ncbi:MULTISPECIES: SCO family protein [Pseudoalteromonas]|uniref:SCO family protein n=1 Tax=Pseudoalteromonas TaxID=53246 RepID=UPI000FFEDB94|nr:MULTISPECIES: SCO family protein [Pseudoalteromonas]MCG9759158.1 SCO family protein [Pseudoalteromonas sp. Isolate6]NKC20150.1 redoxin domain-containing protein [Pseudoalteromonas galatheae]RXE88899.1 SCO family protein [Pseudoalteromonas sp. A757]
MKKLLLIVSIFILFGCGPAPDVSEKVVWYPKPKAVKTFELKDQYGEVVTNQDFTDKWNLLFLGYTSCPDVCPMTLLKLTHVYQSVENKDSLQVWFISVDPERDTEEKRLAYIRHFDPDFKAVSAEHSVLFPFVRDLGLIYAINQEQTKEYYVDHSASVALINPKGQLEAIFKPTHAAGAVPTIDDKLLLADLEKIIN